MPISTETADRPTRALLDVLPVDIAELDAAGGILFTNRSWREFDGDVTTTPRTLRSTSSGTSAPRRLRAAAALEGLEANIAGE